MDDRALFALYLTNLVAMTKHPGYLKEGTKVEPIHDLADLADYLVFLTNVYHPRSK